MDQDLVIRRRVIREADLLLIRQLIEQEGAQGRSHISNRLCEIWDWRQANGRFRQIACRELLRRLEVRGLIELPPRLRAARRVGYRNRTSTPDLPDHPPLRGKLGEFRSQLGLELVQNAKQLALYRGLVGTYHYLGYQQATGAQLKYTAYFQDRPIGCLSFGPAAWKIGARDQFIGWSAQARQQNLRWVVNNERFVILPWVQIQCLASYLLGRAVRQLPGDWQRVYGHDVALVETFVEHRRFAGTAYAAANWRCVGQTLGRGRNDCTHQQAAPIKTIWLRPLREDFRSLLCQT
ncbi:MAG TPA: Druantia anti-phage system protein DruA [Verrucomicrobiae bacterium]|nr:Druantia anti-phage system protein DruA [Verrucomicrobiae bacterium]